MIRLINKHLVTFNIKDIGDEFKVFITVYYRYGCFKIKKIDFDLELSEELTMKSVYIITESLIKELNNITKIK